MIPRAGNDDTIADEFLDSDSFAVHFWKRIEVIMPD